MTTKVCSPLMIDIALWYHTRPGDYGDGKGDYNFRAPGVQALLRELVGRGLLSDYSPLNPNTQRYHATAGLTAYVDALCSVPFPVQRWVLPDVS